jgi:hypothetical protein
MAPLFASRGNSTQRERMNWLTKRSKVYLYRRGASLLSIDTPRVKHSRGGFGQGLQNLLARTGLRAPPPKPNYLGRGLAGGAAAGGLGLAGLAAAYPEDASLIYSNMMDRANDAMTSIGDTGRDEAFPTTRYGPVPIKSPPTRSTGASTAERATEIAGHQEHLSKMKSQAQRLNPKSTNINLQGAHRKIDRGNPLQPAVPIRPVRTGTVPPGAGVPSKPNFSLVDSLLGYFPDSTSGNKSPTPATPVRRVHEAPIPRGARLPSTPNYSLSDSFMDYLPDPTSGR